MNLEQAIELATEAHKSQFRKERPITDDEFLEFIDMGHGNILKSGVKVTWCKSNKNRVGKDPYITHPLTVMNMMDTEEEKIVAVLHDVIEDCKGYGLGKVMDSSRFWIRNRNIVEDYTIPQSVYSALRLLTHEKHQSYIDYIKDISTNKLATKVKLADICHNLSDNASNHARQKYLKAIPVLLSVL